MNQAALPQGLREDLLDGRDQATGAVGDDQQRASQSPSVRSVREISPGLGRLPVPGARPTKMGFVTSG